MRNYHNATVAINNRRLKHIANKLAESADRVKCLELKYGYGPHDILNSFRIARNKEKNEERRNI